MQTRSRCGRDGQASGDHDIATRPLRCCCDRRARARTRRVRTGYAPRFMVRTRTFSSRRIAVVPVRYTRPDVAVAFTCGTHIGALCGWEAHLVSMQGPGRALNVRRRRERPTRRGRARGSGRRCSRRRPAELVGATRFALRSPRTSRDADMRLRPSHGSPAHNSRYGVYPTRTSSRYECERSRCCVVLTRVLPRQSRDVPVCGNQS